MAPRVIDLFAGAGGFGLGFLQAQFDVSLSLEIDQWAADTLRYNHPNMRVIQADIRAFVLSEDIKTVCPFKPDVIIGGPPCQGFSISGPAQKDPTDPRNALFMDFARWVRVLEPRVFVMENVKGLFSRKNAAGEKVVDIITRTFQDLDYAVSVWTLNAAEYGVPQIRERVFIVGTTTEQLPPPPITHYLNKNGSNRKNGANSRSGLPKALMLWTAISDLPHLAARQGAEVQQYSKEPKYEYQEWLRQGSDLVFNHVAMDHTDRVVERFRLMSWGHSNADVPDEHKPRQRNNVRLLSETLYSQGNRKLHPFIPSHTIPASFYTNFVHPYQHRNITAREGARVQSFPDTYRFMGKRTVVSRKLLHREQRESEAHLCQYHQIGNAVPPLLARRIAEYLLEHCF